MKKKYLEQMETKVIQHFIMLPVYILFTLLKGFVSFSDFLDENSFDYVIGAGTSGSVVASRLSEDSTAEILLLEAGGDPLPESEIPFISHRVLATEMDWNYFSKPQTNCCSVFWKKSIPIHLGKAIGGSSSLNFMSYARGNKKDFDNWNQPGWFYQQVLPYFYKLEDYKIPHTKHDGGYHSHGGPISITEPYIKSRLSDVFLEAGHELGYHLVDYTDGVNQNGFSYPSSTIKDGSRMSTHTAYLKPVIDRNNLHLSLNSLVIKIRFDQHFNAIGVIYKKNSAVITVTAKREVIICAGAINSPKLLMLSGLGPKHLLNKFQIPLVVDLAGVGQNLQDHVTILGETYHLNQSISLNPVKYDTKENLDLWKISRTGPMTNPMGFEGLAFLNSPKIARTDGPHLEIKMNSADIWKIFLKHLSPVWMFSFPSVYANTVTFLPTLVKPKSRGEVSLNSADPDEPPIIDPKYLSHPDDVQVLLSGLQFSKRIAQTKSFQRYGTRPLNYAVVPQCISQLWRGLQYYKCIICSMSIGAYNYAGTCKMGSKHDPTAVVDHKLRVYGVKGLRVVDASIMPTLISTETSATCVMIGEKAADMIKLDWMNKMKVG